MGRVKLPSSDKAYAMMQQWRAKPYTLRNTLTGETEVVRMDVAEAQPQKVRSKVFGPEYKALEKAVDTSEGIVQTHCGDGLNLPPSRARGVGLCVSARRRWSRTV